MMSDTSTVAQAGPDQSRPVDDLAISPSLLTAIRRNEWTMLLLSVVVLSASLAFECSPDGHVRLPATTVELPGVCVWKRTTGMDCPGCGLTRSFVSMAHGDLTAAVHYHPFGVVLFLLVATQIPYRAMRIRRLARGRQPRTHPLLAGGLWFVAAGLFGQWLLKILGIISYGGP